jgi:sulfoxide reductase catalytic subunit YedY
MKKLTSEPPSSEITSESLYLRRREFLKDAALAVGTAAVFGGSLLWLVGKRPPPDAPDTQPLPALAPVATPAPQPPGDALTPYDAVTTYNNFYEFGLDKGDPALYAHTLKPRPWTISVEGEVDKPQVIDVDTLLKWFPLEERVYRMRCVEAWSMVIPWQGFPLGELIKKVGPTSKAKYAGTGVQRA